ncbi:MAG TPA: beta-ketoacyl synthase N-terminal-like domain-containing protein, partial [Thermoanaerobaculia bacterium]|nr:beta-ketoacyl synthase N-terminal-like domain-containing protein [Thermoanaerobaculia bacterium]
MTDLADPSAGSPAEGIAIVGMAGRFPGAPDVARFWANLCAGVESITFWSREELKAAGVEPALLADLRYVRAYGTLSDVERFDAAFFGFSPREAEILDPQHRLFLECAWEAVEDAGYDTEVYRGSVGIFGGMGMTSYLLHNLLANPDVAAAAGPLQLRILNDKDFLVSGVAFRLNLTGPCVTVQTACSTSLVATCLAAQSLLNFQCDLALAGGVNVGVPHAAGYLAVDSVYSPDGHCRAFDAAAQGTVGGSAAGVVVLKRLSDALADGDTIHAVLKGFAFNNDGAFKIGYTAPSVDGQLEVIAMAQAVAGVEPETITLVEAHGTGTPMGDPIEVTALTEVFAAGTDRKQFCALGSVKTNIGHTDAAAGVASLIKAVLALENRTLPPSLHYERPNPQIDFAASPFYVNTETRPWTVPDGTPRRAGVSSFSMGGVNSHVVVEEAPTPQPAAPSRPGYLLALSARTATALEAVTDNLIRHLEEHPELDGDALADVAFTLQVGRRALPHRRILVCRDRADALAALRSRDPRRVLTAAAPVGDREPRVAFLFPGLGNQHAGMARDLYRSEPDFRDRFDACADRLLPLLGLDLREALFADAAAPTGAGVDLRGLLGRSAEPEGEADRRLRRTALSQPAVFAVEVCLASLLMDWGIAPEAFLGFSVGEYAAACLSGVLSLEDALRLVAERARLIDGLPEGAMLAVPLGEADVQSFLSAEVSLSAVAGPDLTVLAGPEAAITDLEGRLARQGLAVRRLQTTHAFHSVMMEAAVAPFRDLCRSVDLREPEIPFLSNVTGTWITPEEASAPDYWARHLRQTVRFADGLAELWSEPGRLLVEVGPGQTLSAWALQHPAAPADSIALPALRHAFDRHDDRAFLLQTLGRLWMAGLRVDWTLFWATERRRRIPLPTYPFERRRYWIDPPARTAVMPVARTVEGPEPPTPSPTVERGAHPRPSLPVPFQAPRDETERGVTEILARLLRLDEVGVHDGFFDLGGDSLLATRLIAHLGERFGVELSLREIFEGPTAGELAAALAARLSEGAESPALPRIEPRPRDGHPLLLSFSQRRLWLLAQLDPASPAYNVPTAIRLAGRLDVRVLHASLEQVVARHEALRTTFVPPFSQDGTGEPAQAIAPAGRVPLPLVDLAGLADPEIEARRIAADEVSRPFDLERGPLVRATLLRLAAEEHAALFTMHHIVSDGWSTGLLTGELAALYPTLAEGRPSPLAPLPIQYADFAAWQREWLSGEVLDIQLGYWRERLAGAPPVLELLSDRSRPVVPSGSGGMIFGRLSPGIAAAVQDLA